MSEKRLKFTLESDRQYIGIFDEGYALTGFEVCNLLNSLYQQCEALQNENEQLKQEIKQYWKCRDKWKQEAKELKKEADYFERKKCEYWNMYNEAHLDRIILKKENEQLRQKLDF